jgi:hypothetical protein
MRVFEDLDGGNMRIVSRPEEIVSEINLKFVLIVSLIIQELVKEVVASTKEYLKNMIENKKEGLVNLQNRLKRRSALSKETLYKGNKVQLGILVVVKMGLSSFLYSNVQLSKKVSKPPLRCIRY